MAGGTWAQSCSFRELSITGRYCRVTCGQTNQSWQHCYQWQTKDQNPPDHNVTRVTHFYWYFYEKGRRPHQTPSSVQDGHYNIQNICLLGIILPFQSWVPRRTWCASSSAARRASSPDPAQASSNRTHRCGPATQTTKSTSDWQKPQRRLKKKKVVKEMHKYDKTDLKVLSGVGSPALLPLLSSVDGLDGVQHQVLQLQSFHQVSVPHDSWRRERSLFCRCQQEAGVLTFTRLKQARSTVRVPLSKVLMSSMDW